MRDEKQTDLMKQSKAYVLAAVAALTTASSCSDNATYFDESGLRTDSIVTTDGDGHELSRTLFHYDQNGRTTLVVTNRRGNKTERRTTYSPLGDVEAETITAHGDTIATEYVISPDGSRTTTTTARTADGRSRETTVTKQDSAAHASLSTTTFSNGRQKKTLTMHDEDGNVTEVTTWQRDSEEQPWEPISKLAYKYSCGKMSDGTYSTWAGTKWDELSSETYKYDNKWRLTEKTEYADEIRITTTYTYDSAGNKIEEEQRTCDASEKRETTTETTSLEYGDMRKTEDKYSVASDGIGQQSLTHIVTTTYYSPKPTEAQKESRRN